MLIACLFPRPVAGVAQAAQLESVRLAAGGRPACTQPCIIAKCQCNRHHPATQLFLSASRCNDLPLANGHMWGHALLVSRPHQHNEMQTAGVMLWGAWVTGVRVMMFMYMWDTSAWGTGIHVMIDMYTWHTSAWGTGLHVAVYMYTWDAAALRYPIVLRIDTRAGTGMQVCPNLDILVPALVEGGIDELEKRCALTPGLCWHCSPQLVCVYITASLGV